MKLQENINRIKEMMGVLKEDTSFMDTVSDTYSYSNCDQFHAFNDAGGNVIGGMNIKVDKKLKEIYMKGINPDIVSIDISVDQSAKKVSWTVTIKESKDGVAYIGLYSRGSGCGGSYSRAEGEINIAKSKLEKRKGKTTTWKQIKDWVYNMDQKGNKLKLGPYYARQIFFKYAQADKFPPH